MKPIVEFLNHGILPFIGRETEMEEVLRVCRNSSDVRELRLLLLIGEAGVGKSRLIEQIIRSLGSEEIVPVHVRIYPDTAISVVALLAGAINLSQAIRPLLREDVQPSSGAVLGALRRVTRLRSVVLFVEDIHLLSGESLAEFASLCSALFNEAIAIVCAARPVSAEVRSAMDIYIVREIEVKGFSQAEVTVLWNDVLGSALSNQLANELHSATTGNPLAIRSALRGALRNGMLDVEGFSVTGNLVPIESVSALFHQGAARFGEGLAVHLTPDERKGLTLLSWLGEVFSVEAATAMLGEQTDKLLETLRFKGMLAESTGMAAPLQVKVSNSPLLVFTHSLVHRQFLEGSEPDVNRLIEVLAAQAPLYSRLPLDLIKELMKACTADAATIRLAMVQIHQCASYADHSIEWKKGLEYFQIAEDLFACYRDRFSIEDREYYQAWLLVYRTIFSRRTRSLLPDLIESGLVMTKGREGLQWLQLRLNALHNSCMLNDSPEALQACLEQACAIVDREPELRSKSTLISLFRFIALRAVGDNKFSLLRRVESATKKNGVELGTEQWWGLEHLFTCFAFAYETPEEFNHCESLYRRVDQPRLWRDVRALYPLSRWLFDAGYFHRFLAQIDAVVETYRQHNANTYEVLNLGLKILSRYLVEENYSTADAEMRELPHSLLHDNGGCRDYHFSQLCGFALMRGDLELARIAAQECVPDPPSHVLLDMPLDAFLNESDQVSEINAGEYALFLSNIKQATSTNSEEALSALQSLLRAHILRIGDPLLILAALQVAIQQDYLNNSEIRAAAIDALRRVLTWFVSPGRALVLPMRFLMERYSELLGKEERAEWRREIKRIDRMQKEQQVSNEEGLGRPHKARIKLKMIGEISVQMVDEEPRRLRGERVCACLGALVADQIFAKPLEQVDFNRLATGEEDPDHARKILKVALFRAREAIGSDSIISDDDGIRLNTSRITVDLLEFVDYLKRSEDSLQQGVLARSVRYALQTIEIYKGEVIFPTLYDSIFEAVRDEQEARIRNHLIRLAQQLLVESDTHSAELLMRKGLIAIPDDEEFTELLHESLVLQGYYGDAEIVKDHGERVKDRE